jgi:hypothetical protein
MRVHQLSLRVERGRRAHRRRNSLSVAWRAAQSDARERGDDVQLRLCDRQRFAAQEDTAVRSLSSSRSATAPVAQPGHRAPSRYTRSVAWRHRIALVLLLALTGLPVGGTLCAMACDSASTQAASHHGKNSKCEQPATPSPGPEISGKSAHDCSTHHASMRQVATTAAERPDLSAKSAPGLIGSPSLSEFVVLHDARDSFDYTASSGTAPPTAIPVVLRV